MIYCQRNRIEQNLLLVSVCVLRLQLHKFIWNFILLFSASFSNILLLLSLSSQQVTLQRTAKSYQKIHFVAKRQKFRIKS